MRWTNEFGLIKDGEQQIEGLCDNCGCPTQDFAWGEPRHILERTCIRALKDRITGIESTEKLLERTLKYQVDALERAINNIKERAIEKNKLDRTA